MIYTRCSGSDKCCRMCHGRRRGICVVGACNNGIACIIGVCKPPCPSNHGSSVHWLLEHIFDSLERHGDGLQTPIIINVQKYVWTIMISCCATSARAPAIEDFLWTCHSCKLAITEHINYTMASFITSLLV
eukprot:scaffold98169_cov32-Prasinocladus_malaysianus.AAC.1